MKTQLFRSTSLLFCLIAIITCCTFNPAVAVATDLNVGEPRTVRLIYFLPNDRPYRAEVVQRMKDEIPGIQSFFADMMEEHGYGRLTFRVETDTQGIPIVHRVDGQHPDSRYSDDWLLILEDVEQEFSLAANIYLIAIDSGRGNIRNDAAGFGVSIGKEGGAALVSGDFSRVVVAHEFGHAFGLWHDFRAGEYIMSYGGGLNVGAARGSRLSACAAEFLSVHPYFNPDTPIERGEPPTVELMSLPGYLASTKNIRIKFRVSANDSAGLHQVLLFNFGTNDFIHSRSLTACRGLAGERVAIVEFDYDQVFDQTGFSFSVSALPSHQISVEVVDTNGNAGSYSFDLVQIQDPTIAPIEVDIPDLKLRASIENALGKASGATITAQEMVLLVRLDAQGSAIGDLTGLEFATNLTELGLQGNNISDISAVSGLSNLTHLALGGNSISDISAVSGLTNLTQLYLGVNSITDISAVSSLTNLTDLLLEWNSISDISAVSKLTNLRSLGLRNNSITDISAVSGLTNLRSLELGDNSITDISAVSGLTNLNTLFLEQNSITDISAVGGLSNLEYLVLEQNSITDISAVSSLTNLTYLFLKHNPIEDTAVLCPLIEQNPDLKVDIEIDCQPVEIDLPDLKLRASIENALGKASGAAITAQEMAVLVRLDAQGRAISDLTGLEFATNLTNLVIWDNNISDLSPLVTNTGLGSGDEVNVDGNPLSYTSINTHIPTLRSRGVVVSANNLKPPMLEYLLSVSAGLNLIHVPLKVSAVNSVAKSIESISDLYDALGGASAVNFLITYDTFTQTWLSYFSPADRGTAADRGLTADMGIVAGMKTAATIQLRGEALGTAGSGTISLNQGLNLVGLPLRDSRIKRVSDLFTLEGIRGNVPVVIVTVDGDFKSVGRAGDPGDVPITGGQGFLLTVQRATTVTVSGEGWFNDSATAAPQILTRLPVRHTTPVLALKGSIVDEVSALNQVGFRVAVKNLSTGRQVATTAADAEAGYRLAVVDIETARAAQVGDTLEISAQSTNPFIGVEPLRYAVTAEDVLHGWIQLPSLVAYEIPTETELLANYPNPFNPETWIPYRLAEDADVKLTIYDQMGRVVRVINVGYRVAAAYEHRSKAIYWDGRNAVSEQVASGVYFYHLKAGDYSATRKMVILK